MIVLPDQVITAAGGRGGGSVVITSVRSGCHPDTETRGHWARAGVGGSVGTLSTLGGGEHDRLLGELACQTPCRELLIPLRGQGRGTRVDWTLLNFVSTSADEDTNQLVLIVVHLEKSVDKRGACSSN